MIHFFNRTKFITLNSREEFNQLVRFLTNTGYQYRYIIKTEPFYQYDNLDMRLNCESIYYSPLKHFYVFYVKKCDKELIEKEWRKVQGGSKS